MDKFKCKLCFKQFKNGKALGGHMRSHLATLPLPPKTPPPPPPPPENQESESTLSLCSVSADPEFSDTESTRNPTRRRSKRKLSESVGPSSSSFSDEEEIARCLMMLSQDVWTESKLQCEICLRRFKSTQALGSHRTTHRDEIERKQRNFGVKVEDQKIHECSFCGKQFGSGQALGGHKRSHLSDPGPGLGSVSVSKIFLMIDLNMPAPMVDDDEDEGPVSAVSDAGRGK